MKLKKIRFTCTKEQGKIAPHIRVLLHDLVFSTKHQFSSWKASWEDCSQQVLKYQSQLIDLSISKLSKPECGKGHPRNNLKISKIFFQTSSAHLNKGEGYDCASHNKVATPPSFFVSFRASYFDFEGILGGVLPTGSKMSIDFISQY